MPNLKEWIEAQLKRGYQANQIKQFLVSKGYPPSAVSQVDNVGVMETPKKEYIPKKSSKKPFNVILVLAVIALGVISFYFLNNNAEEQQAFEKERAYLQEFIRGNLKESYYPASLDVKEAMNSANKTIYRAGWESNDILFHTSLVYADNANPDLMLSFSQPKAANLDESISSSIVSKFFKAVEERWKCEQGEAMKICESFWLDGEDKKGVGMWNFLEGNESVLYICKISSGSNSYWRDSCITAG